MQDALQVTKKKSSGEYLRKKNNELNFVRNR